jgi:ATP-dependent exoDNAse (exonuclease V) alpha subunit
MDANKLFKLLQKDNIFLSGGAGVGKSYLTSKIINLYHKNDLKVIPLGSTGISAVNIGGYTLHSFFIFGIAKNLNELKLSDSKNKKRLHELKKILSEIDLIVIDEISMVSSALMDMIYYRLESLEYSGKLLVVGDFYQLPPIIKEEKNALFKEPVFAFESYGWSSLNFKPIILKEIKRTKDLDFIKILEKIRIGICDSEVKEYLYYLKEKKIDFKSEPTYLFGRNQEVNKMNKEKLYELNGQEALYFWNLEKYKEINEKRLSSWLNSLPVLEMLHVKTGAPVIFSVNSWGKFVNGQRGEVIELEEDYIVIKSEGKKIAVYAHEFEFKEISEQNIEGETVAVLSQIPVKLAYAITIHKSQGMSLDNLVVDLNHLFAPSQLYVAISRAIEPKNLKINYSQDNFFSYLNRVILKNETVDKFYGDLK